MQLRAKLKEENRLIRDGWDIYSFNLVRVAWIEIDRRDQCGSRPINIASFVSLYGDTYLSSCNANNNPSWR